MPRITIKSPDDIRREVNSVKQQHKQGAPPNMPRWKRRALSTDLTIDFGQCPRDRVVQAADLATLIECAPGGRLESLSLEHVRVVGDFSEVLQALRTCASAQHLKTFSSYACRLRESTQDMVALGEALSTLPRLQGVSLGLSYMKHHPACKILTPVVQNCQNLQKIFVNGFYAPPRDTANNEEAQFANQEVISFFQACAASTSLKRLLILPMLGRAFAAPCILQALGQVIRQNQSLQTLEMYILSGTEIVHLAEDLKHNTTLQRLALIGRHSPTTNAAQAEIQAFQTALRDHNYTLQELHVEPWNQQSSPELDFELSLNRMGRHKLLNRGACTDEWMEAIANKDDVSAIYYFLRKNPNLCDPKMWTDSTQENEEEASPMDRAAVAAAAAVDMFSSLSDAEVLQAEAQTSGGSMAAVVSPEGATPSSRTTDSGLDSPVKPRVLNRRVYGTNSARGSPENANPTASRKRSREEMEQKETSSATDLNNSTSTAASSSPTASTTMMGVVTTTAYTAAVFAAGYWYRGAANH